MDTPDYLPIYRRGFTLIELIVAIVIAAILVSMAIPAFTDLIAKVKLNAASLQLREVLRQARSEAITSGNTVHICSLALNNQCAGVSGQGNQVWPQGILAFYDANHDKHFTPAQDRLIYHVDFTAGLQVSWGRGDYLIYAGSGRPLLSNGTFLLRHVASGYQKKLIINNVGRIRAEQSW